MSEGMLCWFAETERNISLHSVFYNDIALCCVNSAIMLLSLLASGLVVYKYYQTRARQPVSNTLLLLLASLNLLQSAVAHPLFISMFILQFFGIFHCILVTVAEATVGILLGFSFIMVTIILTSERFFAILYPIYHRIYMRKKVLVYLSLSLLAAWAILFTTFHLIFPRLSDLFYVNLFVVSFGLVYTVAVYVKIFSVSRKSTTLHGGKAQPARSSQLQNGLAEDDVNISGLSAVEQKREAIKKSFGVNSGINMNSNTAYNTNNHNEVKVPTETPCQKMRKKSHNAMQACHLTAKEKKTILRMLCIIEVLYLTTIPILAAFAYGIVRGLDDFYVHYLYPWGTTLVFANGVINAYIYCYRNEHFRTRKPAFKNSHVWLSGNANDGYSGRSRSQQNSTEE